MSELDAVLELQDHDTAIDRLKHRRATLPERAELAAVREAAAEVSGRRDEVGARRDEVAERQAKLERDLAASEARIAEIDKRMYSAVAASRDLMAMGGEIESLKRRVSQLEDDALSTMEEREPLDAEVEKLDAELSDLDRRAGELSAAAAQAEVAIDAELAAESARRDSVAASVPLTLIKEYERLRGRLGGVGAARLEHGSCTGCHLELPATELARIRKAEPTTVHYCDQCGRILVP